MNVFTIRDLDRTPRKVLDFSLREGSAVVRGRSGEAFLITPLAKGADVLPDKRFGRRWIEEHTDWRANRCRKKVPASQVAAVDHLLAGE